MSVAGTTTETTWVIPVGRVRESVDALLGRDAHTFFLAYLLLRKAAATTGSSLGLSIDFAEMGVLLDVPGGPQGKPYLRPFWEGKRNAFQEWKGPNLPGSYSPSSVRTSQLAVVEITADRRFNLRNRHWEPALKHLLFNQRVPVLALAGFLFRNRGFVEIADPDVDEIMTAFRTEYGYGLEDDDEYVHLFDPEWRGDPGAWLEELVVEPA